MLLIFKWMLKKSYAKFSNHFLSNINKCFYWLWSRKNRVQVAAVKYRCIRVLYYRCRKVLPHILFLGIFIKLFIYWLWSHKTNTSSGRENTDVSGYSTADVARYFPIFRFLENLSSNFYSDVWAIIDKTDKRAVV